MLKDKKSKPQLTPMLEGLLTGKEALPPAEHTKPPQTWEEAEKQLDDLMQRRAVAMDVLSKL